MSPCTRRGQNKVFQWVEQKGEISSETIVRHGDPIDGLPLANPEPALSQDWLLLVHDTFLLVVAGSMLVRNWIIFLKTGRLALVGLFLYHFKPAEFEYYSLQPTGVAPTGPNFLENFNSLKFSVFFQLSFPAISILFLSSRKVFAFFRYQELFTGIKIQLILIF